MDSSTTRSALHMYAHRENEILFRLETMIDYMDKLPSHTGLFKDTEQWSLQYDTTTPPHARSTASQHRVAVCHEDQGLTEDHTGYLGCHSG